MKKGKTVLLCSHIIENPNFLCYAYKDNPVESSDSGWQFLCNGAHNMNDAKITSFENACKLNRMISLLETIEENGAYILENGKWKKRES